MSSAVWLIIFPLLFGFLGVLFLVLGLVQRSKGQAVAKWPKVPGEVLAAGLKDHVSTDEDSGTTVSYEPVIQYRYQVAGQEFRSDRYRLGSKHTVMDQKRAAAVAARYPAGTRVDVFYNPQNPADAVLEAGSAGGTVLIVLGVVFLVVACCVLVGLLGVMVYQSN